LNEEENDFSLKTSV